MVDLQDKKTIAALAAADAAVALAEDIGAGDLSAALVSPRSMSGRLICRERAVLCGCAWFEACFLQLDSAATFHWQCADGDALSAAAEVCLVRGRADALLSGERVALNFLQTLSATATAARQLQQSAGDSKVVDTRKTIPKLRLAQKYAVRVGGAHNHRLGLYDEILIKENHIAAAGGIAAALTRARQTATEMQIQIETRTLAEVREAVAAGAKRILLDNFLPQDITAAVQLGDGVEWEVSGNITAATIRDLCIIGCASHFIGRAHQKYRCGRFFVCGLQVGDLRENHRKRGICGIFVVE